MPAVVLCTQLCSILCNPVDYSPPVSSVHGILQARIPDWGAISISRGSSRPRDRSWDTPVSWIVGWIPYHCTPWEALIMHTQDENTLIKAGLPTAGSSNFFPLRTHLILPGVILTALQETVFSHLKRTYSLFTPIYPPDPWKFIRQMFL